MHPARVLSMHFGFGLLSLLQLIKSGSMEFERTKPRDCVFILDSLKEESL